MSYFILDKTIKEIIGLFETHQKAELYYLKINIVERLKIYRHKLLNNLCDNINNILPLRSIEELIEEILNFDENSENTYTYIQGYINRATSILIQIKELQLNYIIYKFDSENIRLFNI